MTNEQRHLFHEDMLRIRRSLDHATEMLARAEAALRVANARLETLTAAVERGNHEQHPPTP
ncbi:MAG: hypothetical protein ACRD0K_19430 [Egibacteraceae bacterium]